MKGAAEEEHVHRKRSLRLSSDNNGGRGKRRTRNAGSDEIVGAQRETGWRTAIGRVKKLSKNAWNSSFRLSSRPQVCRAFPDNPYVYVP